MQNMYEVQECRRRVWYDRAGFRSGWSGDMEPQVRSAERMQEKQGQLLGRARDAD